MSDIGTPAAPNEADIASELHDLVMPVMVGTPLTVGQAVELLPAADRARAEGLLVLHPFVLGRGPRRSG